MNNYIKLFKRTTIIVSITFILISIVNYIILPNYFFPTKYKEEVLEMADHYEVDPLLVYSIMKVESKFNPNAISNRGAKGLMQIMDTTGEWAANELNMNNFTSDKLFDPKVNIEIACWYIAKLIKQYDGDIDTVLAAYNGGTGNVYKWKNNKKYSKDGVTIDYIPFKETRNYIIKVNRNLRIYNYLYKGGLL